MINAWWTNDPAQRYWMETTDRHDLGLNLHAPQQDKSGGGKWTYDLVAQTRPGDIVFHWHTRWFNNPSIVGWSEVVGPLEVVDPYSWEPKTARSTDSSGPIVGRGWRMPCANFHELDQPIDDADLLQVRESVLQLSEQLKRQHGTTYFPFSRYRDRLHATQGYMTKFPAELVPLLPRLRQALKVLPTTSAAAARPRRAAARLQDPALRKAIEEHAVQVAVEHYLAAGASEVEVLGKPYDLRVRGLGQERHVEVKGSSLSIDKILMTVNEVTHARAYGLTDLYVVDEIVWHVEPDGTYSTSAGRERLWRSWTPHDDHLTPLQYQYDLGECTEASEDDPQHS